jgi:hypothetical protein
MQRHEGPSTPRRPPRGRRGFPIRPALTPAHASGNSQSGDLQSSVGGRQDPSHAPAKTGQNRPRSKDGPLLLLLLLLLQPLAAQRPPTLHV